MLIKRNYGIDLLRIISMLGIIGLHVIGQGGLLSSGSFDSINYFIIYFFEIIFYSSVNIFAMITGYLYVNKKNLNYKNLISLIFQIAFYCLLITFIFYGFNFFDVRTLGIKNLIISLFPPIAGRYWYIVCYILVFFAIPYLNKLINSFDLYELKKMLFTFFILLSIITTFGFTDFFKINGGYSPFWLIFCYFLGAYINKANFEKTSKLKLFILFILSSVLTLVINCSVYYLTDYLFGIPKANNLLLTYISPTIVFSSICIFIIFSLIKINSNKFITLLLKLSNAAFAVYCIHCHFLMYDFVFKSNFIFLMDLSPLIIIILIPLIIILIYLLCFIFEQLRLYLFKVFRIENLYSKIELLFKKIFLFFLKKI